MSFDVVVIDYGIGNLYSVRRAFEFCEANVVLTEDKQMILDAPRLILPGVGAFADGMRGLIERGLDKTIIEYVKTGKPLLGICLGMQMLASKSYEFGEHKGLDIIPGKVLPISRQDENGNPHKIPHIGWEDLVKPNDNIEWAGTILENAKQGESFYHVHSFTVIPDKDEFRLADCFYNGIKISSVIKKQNVYGCQFHPEKSGKAGLTLLKQFLEIK
jgi:imidazole glycerol-phosphate synthase subunit HisH